MKGSQSCRIPSVATPLPPIIVLAQRRVPSSRTTRAGRRRGGRGAAAKWRSRPASASDGTRRPYVGAPAVHRRPGRRPNRLLPPDLTTNEALWLPGIPPGVGRHATPATPTPSPHSQRRHRQFNPSVPANIFFISSDELTFLQRRDRSCMARCIARRTSPDPPSSRRWRRRQQRCPVASRGRMRRTVSPTPRSCSSAPRRVVKRSMPCSRCASCQEEEGIKEYYACEGARSEEDVE
jgi:hypothetical protein